MIRKIISIILTLSLFACTINLPVSAEEDVISYKYYQMVDMGFISADEDPEYIVTRGEFAQIITNVAQLNVPEYVSRVYSDISYGDEYFTAIQAVAEAELMNGYGDGTFCPLSPITINESAKVIVDILGYAVMAKAYGGYTKGYIYAANDLELFRGMKKSGYNAPIKREELGIMLYNMFIAPINVVVGAEAGGLSYKKGDITFAQKYYGYSLVSDIVKANSYTNFSYSVPVVGDSQIVIGETLLDTNNNKTRFLIGRYVSAFYDIETEKIVSIIERVENEEFFEVMYYNVTGLARNSIAYSDGNKNKTLRFDDDTICVYNDKYVMSYDFTQLHAAENYRITVIEHDKSGLDKIVFIEDYYTVVAGDITSDYTVTSKLVPISSPGNYGNAKTVNIDEETNDNLFICDKEYNSIAADEIVSGDILTVIENTGYTRVMVSRSTTKKRIDNLTTDDVGRMALDCGGEIIYTVKELESYITENNILGKEPLIYTDIFGCVAYCVVQDEDKELCGLLVEVKLYDFELGERLRLKIFTKDGQEEKFITAERVTINDRTYKPARIIDAQNLLGTAILRPILYSLNENGEVREITLPETNLNGNADGFFLGCSVTGKQMSASQKTIDGKIEVGNETISFVLENNIYNKDTCRVYVGNSQYDHISNYTVDAYYKSRINDTADILVSSFNKGSFPDMKIAVILGKNGVGIFDDNIYQKIKYFNGGEEHIAYINPDKYPTLRNDSENHIATTDAGDAVRISVDENGFIADFDLLYDYDGESFVANASLISELINASFKVEMGYVARNSNGRIRVSPVKAVAKDSTIFNLPMYVLSGYELVVVESGKEISRGTASDINVGDKVVCSTRGGTGRTIVIYK